MTETVLRGRFSLDMSLAVQKSFSAFRISEHTQYRVLEILPGFFVWTTFAVAVFLSFARPLWVIGFIILFDLYWLVRAVYTLIYLIIAFRRFRKSMDVDWPARVAARPGWDRVWHVVIVPTCKEPYELIEHCFLSLAKSRYPLKRLFVVLACEERDHDRALENARRIEERFRGTFGELLITFHPDRIPGEVAGKGANIAWAGRKAKDRIDALRTPYKDILVTTLDVDSVVHDQYFSHLTWVFLHHPNRYRTSYQPLPFYHNNVWSSPALTRVVASSTTFWLMTETVRPDRLFTFSSHSMPFTALVDVDFWQSDIVTEDSRIFLQCYMEYDGDYSVTPIYVPISMDTVATRSLWRTIVNQYKQQRRWAYGVENFPYMVWNFSMNQRIPFMRKVKYLWNQLEGVYSWATAPILIFLLGWLPIHIANTQSNTSLFVDNAPSILQWLMALAMVGLIAAAVLSVVLLPSPPLSRRSRLWLFPMVFQWLLFPLTMVIFGALPATDAQTRLMLGKYLGFWVTEKVRHGAGG